MCVALIGIGRRWSWSSLVLVGAGSSVRQRLCACGHVYVVLYRGRATSCSRRRHTLQRPSFKLLQPFQLGIQLLEDIAHVASLIQQRRATKRPNAMAQSKGSGTGLYSNC
jgi:hypothetical protein